MSKNKYETVQTENGDVSVYRGDIETNSWLFSMKRAIVLWFASQGLTLPDFALNVGHMPRDSYKRVTKDGTKLPILARAVYTIHQNDPSNPDGIARIILNSYTGADCGEAVKLDTVALITATIRGLAETLVAYKTKANSKDFQQALKDVHLADKTSLDSTGASFAYATKNTLGEPDANALFVPAVSDKRSNPMAALNVFTINDQGERLKVMGPEAKGKPATAIKLRCSDAAADLLLAFDAGVVFQFAKAEDGKAVVVQLEQVVIETAPEAPKASVKCKSKVQGKSAPAEVQASV